MRRLVMPALLLPFALSAGAQNEEALRSGLVGKYVTLRIDMPASHKGIDLRFDREQPLDPAENASRIREHDAAIREGDRVQVTYVKLKDDMIEVHLAGGGFNWGSDATTKSFSATSKSSRETELEKRIKAETDRERKRELQDELDDLRRERERRDDRRRREVEEYNERAHERDQERALRSGSRFNLRFKKQVPAGALSADGVIDYLSRWVDFKGTAAASGGGDQDRGSVRKAPRPDDEGGLRKGMWRDEVERRFGKPRREAACRGVAELDCRLVVYDDGSDEVEATFVEDVLVRFGVRRR